MARPIRSTPILYCRDAERFLADISRLPPIEERRRERARIERSVNDFLALVTILEIRSMALLSPFTGINSEDINVIQ